MLVMAGLLVAYAARGAGPLPGDLDIAGLLQRLLPFDSLAGTILVFAGSAVSFLAAAAILVALLLRQWGIALLFLLGSVSGTLLGDVLIKPLVARPRPSAGLVQVYRPSEDYGFPSATALVACVLFGTLSYVVWRTRRSPRTQNAGTSRLLALTLGVALLLLVLNGISRVYVGAHWPTDVLGGWLFGAAWLLVLVAAHGWWLARREEHG